MPRDPSPHFRLGCFHCDREDYDGVTELPKDWTDITEVQTLEQALTPVDFTAPTRLNIFEWQTHLGVCPECQTEDEGPAVT